MILQQFRFLLMLAAVLVLGIAASQADGKKCPLCDDHLGATPKKANPYHGPVVCIRGEVAGPVKVTVHFIGPDGKEYRQDRGAHTKIFSGRWQIKVGRHWFERVKREGGIVRVCAGEKGTEGVRFHDYNVDEHLQNGPLCKSEPVCIFPDLKCPSGKW